MNARRSRLVVSEHFSIFLKIMNNNRQTGHKCTLFIEYSRVKGVRLPFYVCFLLLKIFTSKKDLANYTEQEYLLQLNYLIQHNYLI